MIISGYISRMMSLHPALYLPEGGRGGGAFDWTASDMKNDFFLLVIEKRKKKPTHYRLPYSSKKSEVLLTKIISLKKCSFRDSIL
jgi:hypothetical protein